MIVTKVERLEPLALRKEWMNDFAQAVAFLQSLNLAYSDLRPENILLDRNRIKLSDFDCTGEIGTDFEACMAPYGRVLGDSKPEEGRRGSSGLLDPRTEQFALSSLYYLINYGVEVYGDQCLTEDPKEHGTKVVELLQNMDFPKPNSDPLIDEIIDKCWHNKYKTIADLALNIEMLISGCPDARGKPTNSNNSEPQGYGRGVHPDNLTEDFVWKRALCQNLQRRGLLQLLSSGEPEHLGFTLRWYRHTACGGDT